MKKLWQKVVGGIGFLVVLAGAIFAVLWYRSRKMTVSERLRALSEKQLEQTKESAQTKASGAWKQAADEWAQDQRNIREKVNNEASSLTSDEFFDRLYRK